MLNLNAGDTAGVDAASRVIVAGRLVRQDGPMGVSGDQDMVIVFGPLIQSDLTLVFDMIVFGGTGGI